MKNLILVFALITLYPCPIHGSESYKDSLLTVLPFSKGENKLHTLDRLLVYTIYNDLDSSYHLANELLTEAKKQANIKYESLAYSWLTVYSFLKGNYSSGEMYIKKAIKIQENIHDTLDLGNSYINLLMIYTETGKYKKGIESAFKALNYFNAINDVHGIIAATGNIGIIYDRLKDYDNAIKYYKKTLQLMNRYKEFSNLGEIYNSLGLSYYRFNQNDSALTYFNKAINEFMTHKECKGTAKAYLNIANTYAYNLKNYDSSFRYYHMALNKSNGIIDGLHTKIYNNLGKVYSLTGNNVKAIFYISKSLEQAQNNKDLTGQMNNYYDLFTIYNKQTNYREAIEYLKSYNLLKDSIDVVSAKVTIANLETKHENEKNLIKIQELKNRRQSDYKIRILLISLILFIIVIFILIIRSLHFRRTSEKLKKELITTKNKKLEKDLKFKSRQLTSQALIMIQKNKLINDVLNSLSKLKDVSEESKKKINLSSRKLKKIIHSEDDWELFKSYFENVNPDFFSKLLKINPKLTSSELKLSALIKLKFTIKETADLLNISPNSVKSTRYVLRKKLQLSKGDNIYEFLNDV